MTPHRPLRIAVATRRSGHGGGVEQYLATVVPALVGSGHELACWFETVSPADSSPRWDDVTCWTADQANDSLSALAEWRPDVIFAQGISSPGLERALMALAPSVCFAHSYYGTCISGAKMHRSPTVRCCTRRFGAACLVHYYPRRCGGLSPLTLLSLYRRQQARLDLLRQYDRILVASRHMAAEYSRHGLEDKTRVVPLPIASAARSLACTHGNDLIRLLYLGRLEEAKGAHIAIDSAAMVAASTGRRTELQMSGEGSREPQLKQRAARAMTRDRRLTVNFTGWLSPDKCVDALDQADLLLVPSCWPEPFGMVGVEAALRGVPAVAFAVGGIPEWLTDGVHGRLVRADPPDSRHFADAIIDCLADPGELASMRERCKTSARRFSVDAHITQLNAVLGEVAQVSDHLARAR
jgi:glycosyltransferase involved in cell wall biosynthesis